MAVSLTGDTTGSTYAVRFQKDYRSGKRWIQQAERRQGPRKVEVETEPPDDVHGKSADRRDARPAAVQVILGVDGVTHGISCVQCKEETRWFRRSAYAEVLRSTRLAADGASSALVARLDAKDCASNGDATGQT